MSKLTRRKLIAAVTMVPMAPNGAALAAPAKAASTNPATADPIIAKVAEWMADREAIDAISLDWQDREVALCAKIKPMGMSLTQAYRTGLSEARAMRMLDRKMKVGLKRLERTARAIVLMRPTSAQGALAKIMMGLCIQGPYDWNDDYVYALVQDGCEQLTQMLAREE